MDIQGKETFRPRLKCKNDIDLQKKANESPGCSHRYAIPAI
jgi:hypothetical protein